MFSLAIDFRAARSICARGRGSRGLPNQSTRLSSNINIRLPSVDARLDQANDELKSKRQHY